MKSECLPFSQIPHTTQLFSDFLFDFPKVQEFYSRPPRFGEWARDEAMRLGYDPARRERVAAILEQQNRSWGAPPRTLENIARLRAGASVAVTGQQVGLFGGPAFSIFKALTTVKLADQATRSGADCVPVFWLATEDHDLAEVNHVSIPGANGVLERLTVSSEGLPDAPVGTIRFGAEIEAVVEAAAGLLGDSEAAGFLRECYRPGETLGSAFARLFARVFADWGVILLDASDPALHTIVEPIFRTAIQKAEQLDEALLTRGRVLESAGYHQQVKVTPSSTLLFTLRDGARVPVHRRTNGSPQPDFLIGEERIPQAELQRRIAAAPHHFSPNVLLRPVVQDYLLPTLAYTGGAAEVAYFAQAAVVYEALLGRLTPIVPRFSATLVESKPETLLQRYRLGLPELFHGPDELRERLAAQTLPEELQSAFDNAGANLEQSLSAIRGSLARLDKTLVDAASKAGSKMRHQLERLRSRAARAELRHSEVLARHAELLSNALYPNKTLQEREIGGIYFVARHGLEVLHQLYDTIHTECLDHQVVSLN
ncbi:MAG TPA: bacillithiol biosynthesis cysteine-adding enzyme BshC [Terriglobales bacterium]|nr:bacillithiol biosynthesis cysteine-adding enzyme BshC [Terriglobales bacterium]